MIYHHQVAYIRAHYGPVGLIKWVYGLRECKCSAAAAKAKREISDWVTIKFKKRLCIILIWPQSARPREPCHNKPPLIKPSSLMWHFQGTEKAVSFFCSFRCGLIQRVRLHNSYWTGIYKTSPGTLTFNWCNTQDRLWKEKQVHHGTPSPLDG